MIISRTCDSASDIASTRGPARLTKRFSSGTSMDRVCNLARSYLAFKQGSRCYTEPATLQDKFAPNVEGLDPDHIVKFHPCAFQPVGQPCPEPTVPDRQNTRGRSPSSVKVTGSGNGSIHSHVPTRRSSFAIERHALAGLDVELFFHKGEVDGTPFPLVKEFIREPVREQQG